MTVSPFSQFGSALPTIPSDPHLVREVEIDWCHQLAASDPYGDAVRAQQEDIAYMEEQIALRAAAMTEIDSYLHDEEPATTVDFDIKSDPKLQRTARVTRERRRAHTKNSQPALPPEELGKLAIGEPICAQGVRLTDAQRTVLHGIKAHNALNRTQRQMPVDD